MVAASLVLQNEKHPVEQKFLQKWPEDGRHPCLAVVLKKTVIGIDYCIQHLFTTKCWCSTGGNKGKKQIHPQISHPGGGLF